MQKYDKLVRDNIPNLIEEGGSKATFKKLQSNGQFQEYLIKKLEEEYNEFRSAYKAGDICGIEEELADMLEVIDAVCEHIGDTSKANVMLKKETKASVAGRFYTGTVLLGTEE